MLLHFLVELERDAAVLKMAIASEHDPISNSPGLDIRLLHFLEEFISLRRQLHPQTRINHAIENHIIDLIAISLLVKGKDLKSFLDAALVGYHIEIGVHLSDGRVIAGPVLDLEVVPSESFEKGGVGEGVGFELEILHLVEEVDRKGHDAGFHADVDDCVVGDLVGVDFGFTDLLQKEFDCSNNFHNILISLTDLIREFQTLTLQQNIKGDNVWFHLRKLIIDRVQQVLSLDIVTILQADVEQRVIRRDVRCQTLFLHLLQDDKRIEVWLVGVVLLDQDVVVVDGWEDFFLHWDWFCGFLLDLLGVGFS